MTKKGNSSDGDQPAESSHQTTSTGVPDTASRRRLLHLLGVSGITGLAGCSASPEKDANTASGPSTDTATGTPNLHQSATIGFHYTITADSWERMYGGVTPYFTNIMEPLIWVSEDMTNEPWLATNWEATGEKTWVFELREGVTFHNGEPLTADEVIWSFKERLTVGGGWEQDWLHIKPDGLQKIDDLTVEFTTSDPYPPFPGNIAHNMVCMLHPDVRETGEPIGTGPYKFEEMEKGQYVKVSAFENYWNDSPNMEKLTYREITDSNTRALALTAHEVDVAFNLPHNKFESIKNSDKTNAVTQTRTASGVIQINTATSPTDDQKLRKALNWAVPQETIVKSVLNGIGKPARGQFSPVIPWSAHDSLPEYGPNKAKAKSLVDESEYTGETLELIVDNNRPEVGDLIAETVQQLLQDVGVDLEIQILEPAAWSKAWEDGNGHLFLWETGPNSTAAGYIFNAYLKGVGGWDLWYDVGEEFDSAVKRGNQTRELAVKKKAFGKAQQIMMEKALIIPIYYEEALIGTYSDIEGLDTRPIMKMVRWPPLKHLK